MPSFIRSFSNLEAIVVVGVLVFGVGGVCFVGVLGVLDIGDGTVGWGWLSVPMRCHAYFSVGEFLMVVQLEFRHILARST